LAQTDAGNEPRNAVSSARGRGIATAAGKLVRLDEAHGLGILQSALCEENAADPAAARIRRDAVKQALLTAGNPEKRKLYDAKLARGRTVLERVRPAFGAQPVPGCEVCGSTGMNRASLFVPLNIQASRCGAKPRATASVMALPKSANRPPSISMPPDAPTLRHDQLSCVARASKLNSQ